MFKHSGAPGQGENLYEAFYYPNTAHPLVNGWLSAVDAWYKEIAVYSYTKPGFTSAAGHFSAVWPASCQTCRHDRRHACAIVYT
jgi:Cysteine-rich secretory protein family